MNLFDSANYPTTEPTELIAGDRWQWKRTDLGADYPPASYALSYELRREGDGTSKITIAASETGSDYLVEVAHSATAAYPVGRYHWDAYITRSSDTARVRIGSGIVEVKANRATSADDPRTHARKCLDSIEAALEAFAANTVSSYTITTGTGSRTVTHRDTADLIVLRDRYRAEALAEERAERIANGMSGGGRILVRL